MVKVLIKIFLPFFLGSFFAFWALFGCVASAEEVEIVPDDNFQLVVHSSNTGYTSNKYLELEVATTVYPFSSGNWVAGSSSLVPDSIYLYSTGYHGYYLDNCAYNAFAYDMPDFSISPVNFVVGLDMTDQINGYYRYECHLYVGMCGDIAAMQYSPANTVLDCTPSYTYNSAPVYIGDSENGMHCTVYLVGETNYSYNVPQGSGRRIDYSLVHFYIESTFYYDSSYSTDVAFNIASAFNTMIGSFNYDMSGLRSLGQSQSVTFFYNNRVTSKLFSNVDPPVTPTPTVTPYPGQDTQESINQGVSNIEGQMNQLINSLNPQISPIPTPADLTIDETLFDELETMTLPDVSAAEDTYSALWDIFNPIWWFIALLFSVTFVIGIFLYVLRGGFI